MLRPRFQNEIEDILRRYPADRKRSAIMPLLHLAQQTYGHIAPEVVREIGDITGVAATDVAGVLGFYSLYFDHPAGKRRIQICTDLPCALRGADAFAEQLCQRLGVKFGETTADGEFTLEHVMCVGACDKAPVFQVQDAKGIRFVESPSPDAPMTVEQALARLEELKRE